jgi:transcriptional regulator with XRE-family HTH domain
MLVDIHKLKGRRVEKGFTIRELAKAMGISAQSAHRKLKDTTGVYLTFAEVELLIRILDINNPREYFLCL